MEKNELRRQILSAFDEEAWGALEEGAGPVPVSEANRRTLLRLREEERDFPGSVEEGRVYALRDTLKAYLSREWAEAPEAHECVIQACLALAFLYERPLHPPEAVGSRSLPWEGGFRWFCPAREEGPGSVCAFCRAEPMEALKALWASTLAETAEREGQTSARIRSHAFLAGFQASGVLRTAEVRFHPEVRDLCEQNRCRSYGTTWACPPAVGTLEECRARVLSYEKLLLFSKAYLLEDSMDFRAVGEDMGDFKVCSRTLGRLTRPQYPGLLILSNESCRRCERCTWPEAPCRFPEDLQPSIEGFGFLVSELAQQAGIPYLNGKNTVTFFGAVLYDEGWQN